MEYGGTIDAVSMLRMEIERRILEGSSPLLIIHVDQFGILHAPFAKARSHLAELTQRHPKVDAYVAVHNEVRVYIHILHI